MSATLSTVWKILKTHIVLVPITAVICVASYRGDLNRPYRVAPDLGQMALSYAAVQAISLLLGLLVLCWLRFHYKRATVEVEDAEWLRGFTLWTPCLVGLLFAVGGYFFGGFSAVSLLGVWTFVTLGALLVRRKPKQAAI